MRRAWIVAALIVVLVAPSNPQANASVTWSASSPFDSYTRPEVAPSFDITKVDAAIFDNEQDDLYFYLNFAGVPSKNQFNDGRGSYAAIFLDFDLDGKADFKLYTPDRTLPTNLSSTLGEVYEVSTDSFSDCDLSVFSNIDEAKQWVGFKVLRSCLGIPKTFAIQGYADFVENDDRAFDYAPNDFFRVTLPGSTGVPGTSGSASGSPTHELPTNLANASTESLNFSQAPQDLTALSASLQLSVVTIYCKGGSGSGWSSKATMTPKLLNEGYRSYVITNHHVIEDCLGTKKVTMLLSNNSTVDGVIISWNESSDVAGIVTKVSIPGLEWIGSTPKQGWWIGVIGSPLGKAGILTTGIISSINNNAGTFTLTAAINPGNSGGPAFDSTGRVLGLATSKRLDSSGVLAEGFGNAHGVTLLCGTIITCNVERNPWGAVAKFSAAAELKSKQELEAKAIMDAKIAAEAKMAADKVLAEAKAIADAKAVADKVIADRVIADAKVEAARILAAAQAQVDADLRAKQESEAKAAAEKILADAKLEAAKFLAGVKAAAAKKTTITCTKGKLIKRVTAIKPKCPSGYKVKK